MMKLMYKPLKETKCSKCGRVMAKPEELFDIVKGKESGVVGPIEFELAVIKVKEAKGGLKFLIADASGNYSKESISMIKFKIGKKAV